MKALSVSAPLRGVAAFLAVVLGLFAILASNALVFSFATTQAQTYANFARIVGISVLPLAIIVSLGTFGIRAWSKCPRPLADMALWAIAFPSIASVWLLMASRLDGMYGGVLLSAFLGAAAGLLYWRWSGQPNR